MTGLRIDRCVCFAIRFAELREVASRTGATTIPELQQHIAFGKGCKLCHPYVQRMLETGEVEFREVIPESAGEES